MSLLEHLREDPGCRRIAEAAIHAVAPLLADPDPSSVLRQLDDWAFVLAGRMPLPWNLHLALDALNDLLFREFGFKGDRATYDDPANAVLPRVVERRQGLPIALSILWIDLARRLGLDAVGVALPGHFLAALRLDAALLCFDAFDGGKPVGEERAAALVHQATGGASRFSPDMLRPADDRAVILRLVRNLHVRFVAAHDWQEALWTSAHQILLAPEDPGVHKDRALVHLHRGEQGEAMEALERCLTLSGGTDRQAARWLEELR